MKNIPVSLSVKNNKQEIEKNRDCANASLSRMYMLSAYTYSSRIYVSYAHKSQIGRSISGWRRERSGFAPCDRLLRKKGERKWHAAFFAGGRRDEGVLPRGVITGRRPGAEDRVNDLTGEAAGRLDR